MGVLGTRQQLANGNFIVTPANLFLMNPNGIVFGTNARLDVGGSFAATMANAIGFGDRGSFGATTPSNALPLLTINPSVYMFNQVPTGSIVNRPVADNGVGLQVPNRRNLTLLGGDVALAGGRLSARGGRVDVGAVAAPGRVEILPTGALGFAAELARGNMVLTAGAGMNVAFNTGGEISLTARDIRLAGRSLLLAGITRAGGTSSNRAGDVRLDATGVISVEESSLIQSGVGTSVTGTAGNLVIAADALRIIGGARVNASNNGEGNAGNIVINVNGYVLFQNSDAFSSVGETGIGQGGNIQISSGSLEIRNGVRLLASNNGKGNAGNVVIDMHDLVVFTGNAVAFSRVEQGSDGKGGDISIKASSLGSWIK